MKKQKLKDIVADRLITNLSNNQRTKLIVNCITVDCNNHCTLEKHKHLPGRCRQCSKEMKAKTFIKNNKPLKLLKTIKKEKITYQCEYCGKSTSPLRKHTKYSTPLCKTCVNKKQPYEYVYNLFVKKSDKKVFITYEQFAKICLIPNCHYCDKPLNRSKHSNDGGKESYMLDHKDNNAHYTIENCVPCCWDCNNLKRNFFTYNEFLKLRSFIKKEFGW